MEVLTNDLVNDLLVYEITKMAEYQSPYPTFFIRFTELTFIELIIAVSMLFCLVEGVSLVGVENVGVWEREDLLADDFPALVSALDSDALESDIVTSSREYCFILLLLLWILGGVEGDD